jgi:hypothetical protein
MELILIVLLSLIASSLQAPFIHQVFPTIITRDTAKSSDDLAAHPIIALDPKGLARANKDFNNLVQDTATTVGGAIGGKTGADIGNIAGGII